MKILIILSAIILIYIILDYMLHNYRKNIFKKKLPKEIIAKITNEVELPKIEKSNVINKTIYRTYYDLDNLDIFKKAIDTTQKNMPDYKQVYYDDNDIENFIKDNYSERILNAYLNINPQYGPAKADFFRYLIIYLYGGVYLDIKSAIIENIEEEINQHKGKLLVSKGGNVLFNFVNNFGIIPTVTNAYNWSDFSDVSCGEYNNWHIISPRGHPIIGKMIEQIVLNIERGMKDKKLYNYGEFSVLALSGPIIYTKIIEKYKDDTVKLFSHDFNSKMKYRLEDHKNKGTKKHYSELENKSILL